MDINIIGKAGGDQYRVDQQSAKLLGSDTVSRAQIDTIRKQGMKKVGVFSAIAGFFSGIVASAGAVLALKILAVTALVGLLGAAWPVTVAVCGTALLIGIGLALRKAYQASQKARLEVKIDDKYVEAKRKSLDDKIKSMEQKTGLQEMHNYASLRIAKQVFEKEGYGAKEAAELNETRRSKAAVLGCGVLSFGTGFAAGVATVVGAPVVAPTLAHVALPTLTPLEYLGVGAGAAAVGTGVSYALRKARA